MRGWNPLKGRTFPPQPQSNSHRIYHNQHLFSVNNWLDSRLSHTFSPANKNNTFHTRGMPKQSIFFLCYYSIQHFIDRWLRVHHPLQIILQPPLRHHNRIHLDASSSSSTFPSGARANVRHVFLGNMIDEPLSNYVWRRTVPLSFCHDTMFFILFSAHRIDFPFPNQHTDRMATSATFVLDSLRRVLPATFLCHHHPLVLRGGKWNLWLKNREQEAG